MTTNYTSFGTANLIRFLLFSVFVIFVVYCFILVSAHSDNNRTSTNDTCLPSSNLYIAELLKNYNNTYPLSAPIKSKNFVRYRIGLISDEDKKSGSYSKNSWSAFYLQGYLTYHPISRKVEIKFDEKKHKVTNRLSNAKRGLELSEIIVYNGKLLTCDDKTGIVYELIESDDADTKRNQTTDDRLDENSGQNVTTNTFKLVPNLILSDGDGKKDGTFKCEWLAVKDHQLYAGSFGNNFMLGKKQKYSNYVKRINLNGLVEHLNWNKNYEKLKKALNLPADGYMAHETAMWSAIKQKWYFLPRKVSNISFSSVEDESKGSNIMLEASDDFKEIKYSNVGVLDQSHGFSSSKFLPDFNDDIIVALKTKEVDDSYSTYIIVFDISKGEVLYPETLVDDSLKFEGIEFV